MSPTQVLMSATLQQSPSPSLLNYSQPDTSLQETSHDEDHAAARASSHRPLEGYLPVTALQAPTINTKRSLAFTDRPPGASGASAEMIHSKSALDVEIQNITGEVDRLTGILQVLVCVCACARACVRVRVRARVRVRVRVCACACARVNGARAHACMQTCMRARARASFFCRQRGGLFFMLGGAIFHGERHNARLPASVRYVFLYHIIRVTL